MRERARRSRQRRDSDAKEPSIASLAEKTWRTSGHAEEDGSDRYLDGKSQAGNLKAAHSEDKPLMDAVD